MIAAVNIGLPVTALQHPLTAPLTSVYLSPPINSINIIPSHIVEKQDWQRKLKNKLDAGEDFVIHWEIENCREEEEEEGQNSGGNSQAARESWLKEENVEKKRKIGEEEEDGEDEKERRQDAFQGRRSRRIG